MGEKGGWLPGQEQHGEILPEITSACPSTSHLPSKLSNRRNVSSRQTRNLRLLTILCKGPPSPPVFCPVLVLRSCASGRSLCCMSVCALVVVTDGLFRGFFRLERDISNVKSLDNCWSDYLFATLVWLTYAGLVSAQTPLAGVIKPASPLRHQPTIGSAVI